MARELAALAILFLAGAGWANTKPKGLKPAKFGTLPGFRFSFRMVSEDGLECEGMVLGAVREDTLRLIAFMGTRLHYFPKHKKDVEKLFASVRT